MGTLKVGTNRWRDWELFRRQMVKMLRAGIQSADILAIAYLLGHQDHAVFLILSDGSSHHQGVSCVHGQVGMHTCGGGVSGNTISGRVRRHDTMSLSGSMRGTSSVTKPPHRCTHFFFGHIDSTVSKGQLYVSKGQGVIPCWA